MNISKQSGNIILLTCLFFTLILSAVFSGCSKQDTFVDETGNVDWNKYYTSAETNSIMREFAVLYPDMVSINSLGKSWQGKDLLLMEITNTKTKQKPYEKPALYVDGNIHSGELTGSAVSLYLAGYLLQNYENNPRIKRLLDTRTFYIRPKFNPDGADLALLEGVSLRSSVKPFDNDNDGEADEDPQEDLDGDGYFTYIRYKDPEGRWKLSPDDNRILLRRERGEEEGEFYTRVPEGIDNDKDGRINEDGIGGLDLNRNFPRNWELQYLQPGAGAFPLSEPETYAAVKFINEHPNITGIVHNHTSGGFIFRLPSTANPNTFDPDDLNLINVLGSKYTELTGRPVERSYTSPERHRYGTLISWGFWDKGIIGWVPEYWPGFTKDFDNDGEVTEIEKLRFNEEEFGGKYFINWKKYDHPDLGEVEIGGWRSMYVNQNPPPELLEKECEMQIPWILYLAESSPLLKVSKPEITEIENNKFRVEVSVSNTGLLPTNLTNRAIDASLIRPVAAIIKLTGCKVIDGNNKVTIGHLAGGYNKESEYPASKTISWILIKESNSADLEIIVESEKGGKITTSKIILQ